MTKTTPGLYESQERENALKVAQAEAWYLDRVERAFHRQQEGTSCLLDEKLIWQFRENRRRQSFLLGALQ